MNFAGDTPESMHHVINITHVVEIRLILVEETLGLGASGELSVVGDEGLSGEYQIGGDEVLFWALHAGQLLHLMPDRNLRALLQRGDEWPLHNFELHGQTHAPLASVEGDHIVQEP